MPSNPDAIIDYWIGPQESSPEIFGEKQKLWYTSSDDTDKHIEDEFGEALGAAEAGELDDWAESLTGSLALVILLDQFSRNLYRGTPDAYRNDGAAQSVAKRVIDSGEYQQLNIPAKTLLYHPYHHAEDKALQDKCVALFEELLADSSEEWQEQVDANLQFVKGHCSVVHRFGRFPHRNKVLNRSSTEEELAYLEEDARTYGQ